MNKSGWAAGGAAIALTWSGVAAAQAPPPAPTPDAAAADTPTADAEPAPEPPPPAAPPPTISDQIAAGKLLLEVRSRFEDVDQTRTAPLKEAGQAFTVRTRLGWESADWNGLKALVEFEDVRHVGAERFAVNVPGATTAPLNGASKSKYPIINDPDVTELNRAQLTWVANPALTLTAGRQRILLDDQRFVGNVGWRQDEQTFDGVRADMALGRFKATYAYVTRINRILGEEKDWHSDSQIFNATWSPAEALRLQGFVHALDFDNSPVNASLTKGIKASGKTWVGLYQLAYDATWANQSDYRHRTAAFDLDYLEASVAGTFDIYTLKLGYEQLDGDGKRGFTTPLATTHGFQGWADAWVSPGGNKSFIDGIKDTNLTLNVKPRFKRTYFFNTDLVARYHDFNDQKTGADLAHEWDLQATAAITTKLSVQLKYADFQREATVPLGTAAPPASRTKVWLTLEYKL
jgi:hypothetical protein